MNTFQVHSFFVAILALFSSVSNSSASIVHSTYSKRAGDYENILASFQHIVDGLVPSIYKENFGKIPASADIKGYLDNTGEKIKDTYLNGHNNEEKIQFCSELFNRLNTNCQYDLVDKLAQNAGYYSNTSKNAFSLSKFTDITSNSRAIFCNNLIYAIIEKAIISNTRLEMVRVHPLLVSAGYCNSSSVISTNFTGVDKQLKVRLVNNLAIALVKSGNPTVADTLLKSVYNIAIPSTLSMLPDDDRAALCATSLTAKLMSIINGPSRSITKTNCTQFTAYLRPLGYLSGNVINEKGTFKNISNDHYKATLRNIVDLMNHNFKR